MEWMTPSFISLQPAGVLLALSLLSLFSGLSLTCAAICLYIEASKFKSSKNSPNCAAKFTLQENEGMVLEFLRSKKGA